MTPTIHTNLYDRSVLVHLRIPFSFFLMPVFFFALSQSEHPDFTATLAVFIILHLLLYPASNAYNSYYDKDEGSIGGIEHPPPVSKKLLYAALVFDGVAILLGMLISWLFAGALLIYGLVSKAYSNDHIRLKKYPLLSWLVVGLFQGAFTYLMVYHAINSSPLQALWQPLVLIPAGLSSLLLMAAYPMTQIYQHEEDTKRGDFTLSCLLGIRGTFVFTAVAFFFVNIGFFFYFQFFNQQGQLIFILFQTFLLPVLIYFFSWLKRTWKEPSQANFHSAMKMNLISALCMNLYFIMLFFMR